MREHTFDKPVRKGAVVSRLHEGEGTAVVMIVRNRLRDIDSGAHRYEIADPTLTGYHTYRHEDFVECFRNTDITWTGSGKPIQDDLIRDAYQTLHEKYDEHSYTVVHEREDGELVPAGLQCPHCKKRKGANDD